jgi:hypothetical protein
MKGGAMTVQELIEELEDYDAEAEVRFLAQPSWPFEYTIAAVVEAIDRPDDLSGYRETPADRVLLVEGRQACYGESARSRRPGARGRRERRAASCSCRAPDVRRAAASSSPPRPANQQPTRRRRPSR